ncbi:hypothetical protein HBB16_02175 [Pseudonocardia sp. MCCB 268]|nr:hypothetical protein [Pseudonocardia cytotoxica]
MTISVFDMFKVGIGPSSSHTLGPMPDRVPLRVAPGRVRPHQVDRHGPRGAVRLAGLTGHGRRREGGRAGLAGHQPHLVDPVAADPMVDDVGQRPDQPQQHPRDPFSIGGDVVLHRNKRLDFLQRHGAARPRRRGRGRRAPRYYSVGGGFVLDEDDAGAPVLVEDATPVAHRSAPATSWSGWPASTACRSRRSCWPTSCPGAPRRRSAPSCCIWSVMQVRERGDHRRGAARQAQGAPPPATLRTRLVGRRRSGRPARHGWVTLYALAVNEENAAGAGS